MFDLKAKIACVAALPFFTLTSCDQGHSAGNIAIRGEIIKVQDVGVAFEIRSIDGKVYCISKYDLNNISENYQIFDKNGAKIVNTFHPYLGYYGVGGQNLSGGVLVIGDKPLYHLTRMEGFSGNYDKIGKIEYKLDYFECNQIGRQMITAKVYMGSVAKKSATLGEADSES